MVNANSPDKLMDTLAVSSPLAGVGLIGVLVLNDLRGIYNPPPLVLIMVAGVAMISLGFQHSSIKHKSVASIQSRASTLVLNAESTITELEPADTSSLEKSANWTLAIGGCFTLLAFWLLYDFFTSLDSPGQTFWWSFFPLLFGLSALSLSVAFRRALPEFETEAKYEPYEPEALLYDHRAGVFLTSENDSWVVTREGQKQWRLPRGRRIEPIKPVPIGNLFLNSEKSIQLDSTRFGYYTITDEFRVYEQGKLNQQWQAISSGRKEPGSTWRVLRRQDPPTQSCLKLSSGEYAWYNLGSTHVSLVVDGAKAELRTGEVEFYSPATAYIFNRSQDLLNESTAGSSDIPSIGVIAWDIEYSIRWNGTHGVSPDQEDIAIAEAIVQKAKGGFHDLLSQLIRDRLSAISDQLDWRNNLEIHLRAVDEYESPWADANWTDAQRSNFYATAIRALTKAKNALEEEEEKLKAIVVALPDSDTNLIQARTFEVKVTKFTDVSFSTLNGRIKVADRALQVAESERSKIHVGDDVQFERKSRFVNLVLEIIKALPPRQRTTLVETAMRTLSDPNTTDAEKVIATKKIAADVQGESPEEAQRILKLVENPDTNGAGKTEGSMDAWE